MSIVTGYTGFACTGMQDEHCTLIRQHKVAHATMMTALAAATQVHCFAYERTSRVLMTVAGSLLTNVRARHIGSNDGRKMHAV